VRVGEYEVELLAEPGPLRRGEEARLVARVLANPSLRPATGGAVLMGFGPEGTVLDPEPAVESAWAGQYGRLVRPERAGPYRARVVLVEAGGSRLDPPLVLEIPLTVEPAPGMSVAGWTFLLALGGLGGLGLYLAGPRLRAGAPPGEALDLLAVPGVRRLLTSRRLQPALQWPMLALTAVAVFLGLADVQDGSVNLATRLVWTLWWAGIIFTFVVAGRAWCLACPLGAVTEWASRLAGAAGQLPRPFRNLWWATGAFVLLTWADEQLGVVRSPRVTAWLLLGLVALAAAVGLGYTRRSFCRHLCPIGGVIGLYSMLAPVELRTRSPRACDEGCGQACYRGTAAGPGCPMLQFPRSMDRNNECTLCAACVRACPRGNLLLRLRAFGRDLWGTRRRVLDEAYLAVVLVGLTLLVTVQMLSAWPAWVSGLARGLPGIVRAGLAPVTYLGLVESALLLGGSLLAGPLLMLGGAALADRLAGARRVGVRRTFVAFAYMFVPVGLGLHLAHNLAHLLLEGGGVVAAGQRALQRYTPFSAGEPDWQALALAPEAVVGLLQAAVLAAVFGLSLAAGQRLALAVYRDPATAGRALWPMALLSFAFTAAGVVLLQQPMGMRHVM
jgi:ferredoxin